MISHHSTESMLLFPLNFVDTNKTLFIRASFCPITCQSSICLCVCTWLSVMFMTRTWYNYVFLFSKLFRWWNKYLFNVFSNHLPVKRRSRFIKQTIIKCLVHFEHSLPEFIISGHLLLSQFLLEPVKSQSSKCQLTSSVFFFCLNYFHFSLLKIINILQALNNHKYCFSNVNTMKQPQTWYNKSHESTRQFRVWIAIIDFMIK